jgi:hypothetical protein
VWCGGSDPGIRSRSRVGDKSEAGKRRDYGVGTCDAPCRKLEAGRCELPAVVRRYAG